ncbi:hypothetical protein COV61_05685 [Candidatus Micrarchaeota archaeon CG11_big_fil_rev_8_21_14_0_20_47_5]|nr:MAG: hypothetical protein AUJ17_00545 [Candidatus Micrarchaeota archaeon CG1_02_47_40]PIN82534.1 MAG: hypothetical protein COV61_05685 [Candidatus Micrarchaeota archaeon CG11_big_fil_rev_8_21_14_0_20_47_5]
MSGNSVELSGKRSEIMHIIEENPLCKTFILKVKPSKSFFAVLLSKTKVKKLIATKGILKTIGKDVLSALRKNGVRVEVRKSALGRKRRIGNAGIVKAIKRIGAGETLEEAAKLSGLSKWGLIYRLKEFKRKNGKRGSYGKIPKRGVKKYGI